MEEASEKVRRPDKCLSGDRRDNRPGIRNVVSELASSHEQAASTQRQQQKCHDNHALSRFGRRRDAEGVRTVDTKEATAAGVSAASLTRWKLADSLRLQVPNYSPPLSPKCCAI